MVKTFEIELVDIEIACYDVILSRFSNWEKYKREINLNQLLEQDKKNQFEVEIKNSNNLTSIFFYVTVSTNDDFKYETSLKNVCGVINKFTFIILNNKVIKLEVELKIYNNRFGKNILKSDIGPKLYQHLDKDGKIDNFYFKLSKSIS